jgi:glycosidase
MILFTTNFSFAQTHWWNESIFYEVFVRSYKDSDGDGNGDIKGLIEKIDYLNDGDSSTHEDLGVTALWLMPIMESPSYHGYDVKDYRTVEQDYGTNEDFKNLITEAHKRGIKVIIDFVMNHTSSQHPWFQQSIDPNSSKRNWYIWQSTKPSGTGPWGQTIWYPKNGNYYYALFWSEMPDLNYTTPEVKTEMFDVARFWLQDMNVDGFRLDAARYIIEDQNSLQDTPETIQFWKDFRSYYKSIDTAAFAVGEAWTNTDQVVPYVTNNGLDYCFEFDLAQSIVNAANNGSASALQTQVEKVMSSYPYLQFGTFLTNHDMNRVMDQLGNSNSKAMLASDLLLTLPGIPYLYYGEEIGMNGSGADENKRTPLQWNSSSKAGFTSGTPWRAVNSNYTSKNIESQQIDNNSIWSHYKNLISIHQNQKALQVGNYNSLVASNSSVFTFHRQIKEEHLVIVSNTGASDLTNVMISSSQGQFPQGNFVLVPLTGGDQLLVTVDNTGSLTNVNINQISAQSSIIYKLLDASKTKTSITFEVDMNQLISKGYFNPATETVDIVASFNSFGSDSITKLQDFDGNGIYEVTIWNMTIGSTIDYKYRINGVNDGREEFANSNYVRSYLVMEDKNRVKDNYQSILLTSIDRPKQSSFSVFPIPATDNVFLNFSLNYLGRVNYKVTNLLGEEMVSGSFNNFSKEGQITLSCNILPDGIYLLNLTYNDNSEVLKLVIQK